MLLRMLQWPCALQRRTRGKLVSGVGRREPEEKCYALPTSRNALESVTYALTPRPAEEYRESATDPLQKEGDT